MKAKNSQQAPLTSEVDAKEKLIVYVYEYLVLNNAKQAADIFRESIGYTKEIKLTEGSSFLAGWWDVFWDLYCAAPERRHLPPEPSNDAIAFMKNMGPSPMSPTIAQLSPPQHLARHPPGPQFMGGQRYVPMPVARGPPMPRPQGPTIQHGAPHPGGPPPLASQPPNSFMPAGSPRYMGHQPGPPPQPAQPMNQPMNQQGMMFSPGPEHQMGGPSPLNSGCSTGGPGEPSTPHPQDEYVIPEPFGHEPTGQCESTEVIRIKQSLQDETSNIFEREHQPEYNEYPPESKWS